jgi:hypothetical protein
MLLTPRLSFEREYLGFGLFHLGPAAALFRRQAFVDLGGFPEEGVHSDTIFWLGACARVNIVLVSGDLFYYRVHPGQELQSASARYDSARDEARYWRVLDDPSCPLQPADREVAKRNKTALFAKHILRDLRGGHWHLAWFRFRHAGLSLGEWVRYLRRPRRSAAAGTPAATGR